MKYKKTTSTLKRKVVNFGTPECLSNFSYLAEQEKILKILSV